MIGKFYALNLIVGLFCLFIVAVNFIVLRSWWIGVPGLLCLIMGLLNLVLSYEPNAYRVRRWLGIDA